jgi:hypothetical protein
MLFRNNLFLKRGDADWCVRIAEFFYLKDPMIFLHVEGIKESIRPSAYWN